MLRCACSTGWRAVVNAGAELGCEELGSGLLQYQLGAVIKLIAWTAVALIVLALGLQPLARLKVRRRLQHRVTRRV